MSLGTALSVGGSLLGALAGSQKTGGGTQTTTSTPWSVQSPYLDYGFQQAKSAYQNQAGTPYYQGQLYAPMSAMTGQGVDQVGQFANGQGAALASGMSGAAQTGLGALSPYLSTAQQVAQAAGSDPTQANIAAATAYANNPATQGIIDASLRDVNRDLNENQLPQVARNAALTGNSGSTRTGVQDAILTRGAQDRAADIASTIRGNQFNAGLGLAEQSRVANLQSLLGAGNQFGNAAALGMNAAGQAQQMGYNNADAQIAAGQVLQQNQQGQDNADFQRWQGQDQRANDLLNRYWGIVGNRSWGGTSDTQLPTYGGGVMGAVQGAVGGAAAGAGLYKSLYGKQS